MRLALTLCAQTLICSVSHADSDGGSKNPGTGLTTVARVATSYNEGFPVADKVVVRKAERKLQLIREIGRAHV